MCTDAAGVFGKFINKDSAGVTCGGYKYRVNINTVVPIRFQMGER